MVQHLPGIAESLPNEGVIFHLPRTRDLSEEDGGPPILLPFSFPPFKKPILHTCSLARFFMRP